MSVVLTNISVFFAISVSGYLAVSYSSMIVIPLIMLVLFVVTVLRNRKLRRSAAERESIFSEALKTVDFEQTNAFESLQAVSSEVDDEELSDILDTLSVQSEKLYKGNWLPDP
ncbi:MAG: hypothetical protein PHV73_00170, partial [Eubacteriales bacterium]|nr:hypothetical protein [Eubacteriales bacterium]